jgi:GNAT superfamily N-acetyltransferase
MDIVMPFDKIDSMRAFESGNTEIEAGFSNINEIYDGETIRFEYKDGESVVGTISLTPNGPKSYDVSGFFVDPSERGKGIGSMILQIVMHFLNNEKAKGTLINMVHGDSGVIYTNNGWIKTEYKSQGAYGGYEYVYDARERGIDPFPRLGYCYKGFRVVGSEKHDVNIIFRGSEKGKLFVFDGENEYEAVRCSKDNEEPMFEFRENDIVEHSENLN